MKRQIFFILLSLSGQDRHGLDIQRDVLELTGGELRLWPATLYGSLDELREEGWIEEMVETRPEGESERKRFYRISDAGRRALMAETRRIEGLVEVARLRMREAP